MNPQLNKIHEKFKLNGIHFGTADMQEVSYSLIKEGEAYEQKIGDFLVDWISEDSTIEVNTSGSTGTPKTISLKKEHMVNSARLTGEFFDLGPGSTALMCLPAHTIAGRMMLVRAMVLGWELELVNPSSNPLSSTSASFDFCAMVPLQLFKSIGDIHRIGTLLVGGAKLSSKLIEELNDIPTRVYESYGMTETCSHIALKDISAGESGFTTMSGITIETDERGCLLIDAPELSTKPIQTNDLAELYSPTQFKWLGRWDNVINSGGVKIVPETVEKKLEPVVGQRLVVLGIADDELGQKLVLVVEGEVNKEKLSEEIRSMKKLDKFEKPREIYSLPGFPENSGGKASRSKILELIAKG